MNPKHSRNPMVGTPDIENFKHFKLKENRPFDLIQSRKNGTPMSFAQSEAETAISNDISLLHGKSFIKNANCLRDQYLTKLSLNGLLQKGSNFNSIFIFDWDDTLMCTNFLRGCKLEDPEVRKKVQSSKHIAKLEQSVESILSTAIEQGDVYIVSNGNKDWIFKSWRVVLPKCYDKFSYKVKVVSARDSFEGRLDRALWKNAVMDKIAESYDKRLLSNIVVIGDDPNDIKSGRNFGGSFENCYLKTVKFKSAPNLAVLARQLSLLDGKLMRIVSNVKNMNIVVENKEKCKFNAKYSPV